MFKAGFIGAGNMGSALIRAVSKSVDGENVAISDRSEEKVKNLSDELGCKASDNNEIALNSKFIFLAVKPQMMGDMLSSISEALKSRKDRFILVSIAAGMAKEKIRTLSGGNYPVIRIMPNTPVSVNSGMILYSPDAEITDGEISEFKDLLKFSGELDMIDETKIDAASAISGCGPAYVYIFAEALADAGVECGLPRDKAIDYAVQTILGAAELMKKSDKHSAQLKDEVCSPAGSTICGVRALEENGFRAASIKAVLAAYKRTVELGK